MTQIDGTQRRGLTVLLFFTFFMVMGFDMIMPLIIGHYVNNLAFTAAAVGTALAVRQFSQQGLALVGGALADRFSARTLISIGVLLRAVGFVVLAFAEGYALLLAAMVVIGLGGVFFEMPYQTAIAVLTTEKNRSRYYSLNNTITGIASAIAPLLGVALLRLDFKTVCFGAAFCFAVNFVISCFIMPNIKRTEQAYKIVPSLKTVFSDRKYLCFVLMMVVFWLAAAQIDITYPLRVQEIYGSEAGVGIMYTVYAVIMTVLQYPVVTLLLRKLSELQCAVLGIAIIAAAILLTAFVSTPFVFMVVVAIYTIGMLIARPNQQNIAVSMANPRALGMYLGVNSLAFAIGKGMGTILGGAVYDSAKSGGTPNLPWFLFCGIAIAAMIGFVMFRKYDNSGTSNTA